MKLIPTGRQWCQAAFGREPAESEIAVAARRHKSVCHGVAILEVAHHLATAGYAVETEPGTVLAAEDGPWRARAEPDLAFTLSGEVWRKVSPRVVAKWAKSLELCGRLALVLYHEEARRKQQMILFEARYKLPEGRVLLSSIEAVEAGGWAWKVISPRGEGGESPVGTCRSDLSHVHKTIDLDALDRQAFTAIRGQVFTIDCQPWQ